MIREWRISRFKSIVGSERLALKPLTVLAGPNSSGKSSVIQSILLISQTVSSQVQDKQLVLNGELTQLGSFDDVCSQESSNRTIEFGFRVDLKGAGSSVVEAIPHGAPLGARAYQGSVADLSVDATVVFGPSGPDVAGSPVSRLQADLLDGRFRISVRAAQASLFPFDARESHQPDIRIRRRSDNEPARIEGGRNRPIDRGPLGALSKYDIHMSPASRRAVEQRRAEWFRSELRGEVVGPVLAHFLPSGVVWRQRELPRAVAAALRGLRRATSREIQELLTAWLANERGPWRAIARGIAQEAQRLSEGVVDYVRNATRYSMREERIESLVRVADELLEPELRDAVAFFPGPLSEKQDVAFQSLRDFLGGVRYLGPLRDDPKPVYSGSGAVDPTAVGSKGQFTAAVLDINRDLQVEYVRPRTTEVVRGRLSQAVEMWLRYFGIAESVSTHEEGKLGYRLTVRMDGVQRDVDLTNVGVGVSQVLPILVMTLVSPRGALLLFEQPELHLHPAVQSQLADFFVAMCRAGRQCIVETHSEYLINRLRLRIAEADSPEDLQSLATVHFVERVGGRSRFRVVDINRFGAIQDWPEGFFDQGPGEAERILKAGMARRSRSKQ
ncbi:MAG: DUF3696 domain-containing protein [Vicinamibacterales bacterium]